MGKRLYKTIKWAASAVSYVILLILLIETGSFLVITISNLLLYGHPREGSRAVYDPYTIFQMESGRRPTTNGSAGGDRERDRVIWLFGGSTLRGDTEDDSRTIPSLLAAYLNRNGRPYHFTAVNFGVNSFNSLLEVQYLEKALIESDDAGPDLVIFYDGANDAKYLAEHRTPSGHYGYRRIQALIESYHRSRIGLFKPIYAAWYASFTRELIDKFHQVAVPMETGSLLPVQAAEQAARRYDHVFRTIRCQGSDFLVFWQPTLWTETCRPSDGILEIESGYPVHDKRLKAMKQNFQVVYQAYFERLEGEPWFVRLDDGLCSRTSPAYQEDGVHLTDEGRRMAAEAMGREILGRMFPRK